MTVQIYIKKKKHHNDEQFSCSNLLARKDSADKTVQQLTNTLVLTCLRNLVQTKHYNNWFKQEFIHVKKKSRYNS